jgi:hypothetical protein
MEKTTALYAYFGELGTSFTENVPGHSFYQVGLMDAIAEKYQIVQFDFLNYINPNGPKTTRPTYPDSELGKLFSHHSDRLIDSYLNTSESVLRNIENKEYSHLFLKARFRNLSTLTKKLKDAQLFEQIIHTALASGYDPANIVIVDTDLSLSESFLATIETLGITREIPSITIKGLGGNFLSDCLQLHGKSTSKRSQHLMYYGNLDFSNYKEGQSKDPIVLKVLESVSGIKMFDGTGFDLTIAAKRTPDLEAYASNLGNFIGRQERDMIWDSFTSTLACINVSKGLYLEKGFTPARVYESVIFGTVPVSYNPTGTGPMEFRNVDDFTEICKFLAECSPADYHKVLFNESLKLATAESSDK